MIDVVRSVAAAAAVQTEVAIDVTNAKKAPPARALGCFEISDSLAGVFSDLATSPKWDRSETTLAVDW